MKIAHLHLKDGFGNPRTLICNLKDEKISYIYYGGWNTSGMPHALSNLQCVLPIENLEGETREQFKARLIKVINTNSVERVVNDINTEVKFL